MVEGFAVNPIKRVAMKIFTQICLHLF